MTLDDLDEDELAQLVSSVRNYSERHERSSDADIVIGLINDDIKVRIDGNGTLYFVEYKKSGVIVFTRTTLMVPKRSLRQRGGIGDTKCS